MGRIEDIEDQENAVQLALGDVEESTDDYMWRDEGTSNEESVMMLKKLRIQKGLTQSAAAKTLQVSLRTYITCENETGKWTFSNMIIWCIS